MPALFELFPAMNRDFTRSRSDVFTQCMAHGYTPRGAATELGTNLARTSRNNKISYQRGFDIQMVELNKSVW